MATRARKDVRFALFGYSPSSSPYRTRMQVFSACWSLYAQSMSFWARLVRLRNGMHCRNSMSNCESPFSSMANTAVAMGAMSGRVRYWIVSLCRVTRAKSGYGMPRECPAVCLSWGASGIPHRNRYPSMSTCAFWSPWFRFWYNFRRRLLMVGSLSKSSK